MKLKRVNVSLKSWGILCDDISNLIQKGKKLCCGIWEQTDNLIKNMSMKFLAKLIDLFHAKLKFAVVDQLRDEYVECIIALNHIDQLLDLKLFISSMLSLRVSLNNILDSWNKIK